MKTSCKSKCFGHTITDSKTEMYINLNECEIKLLKLRENSEERTYIYLTVCSYWVLTENNKSIALSAIKNKLIIKEVQ